MSKTNKTNRDIKLNDMKTSSTDNNAFTISYKDEFEENKMLSLVRSISSSYMNDVLSGNEFKKELFEKDVIIASINFINDKIEYLTNIEEMSDSKNDNKFYDFIYISHLLDMITLEDKLTQHYSSLSNIVTLMINEFVNLDFVLRLIYSQIYDEELKKEAV